MVNLQSVLLKFAEPFMDARYTKVCSFVLPMLRVSQYFVITLGVFMTGRLLGSVDGSYRLLLLFGIYSN